MEPMVVYALGIVAYCGYLTVKDVFTDLTRKVLCQVPSYLVPKFIEMTLTKGEGMKRQLIFAVILTTAMAISAHASVNIGINVGIPAPLPSSVVIETPPEFIYSPELGFHVSAGSPYDIVYIGNDYYLYKNGYYYRSHHYNGPWVGVEGRRLPLGLRMHRFDAVRHYRDREYRKYNRDREHYNGRWYRPGEVARNEHRGGKRRRGEYRGGEGRRYERLDTEVRR